MSDSDTFTFRALGVVFLAVGVTMGVAQGWGVGVAFVAMGSTFIVIGWVRDSED